MSQDKETKKGMFSVLNTHQKIGGIVGLLAFIVLVFLLTVGRPMEAQAEESSPTETTELVSENASNEDGSVCELVIHEQPDGFSIEEFIDRAKHYGCKAWYSVCPSDDTSSEVEG